MAYDVAIIGGGFSGTMVAVHLARLSAGQLRIALIERKASPALGVAYGTVDPKHLLNVRAGQMGAFQDDIGHFWTWLQRQTELRAELNLDHSDANSFVPRLVYGKYLQSMLRDVQKAFPNLHVLQQDVTDIKVQADGGYEIISQGQTLTAKSVVLALGNFPPGETTKNAKAENPYAPEVWKKLAAPGDVLIIGTGLTSLDLVMTLAETKSSGVIHLLSRRGLLPGMHPAAPPKAYTEPFIDPQHLPQTALRLCRLVRGEIKKAASQGFVWQSVIDAMRPFNQRLWEALNPKERKRFLRFLRAYWDVHRHRCAPEIKTVYDCLKSEGRLVLHRGHIVEQNYHKDKIDIVWRPYGKNKNETFTVSQIANCTGPQSDCRKLDDALVQNLLAHDLIAPDPLRIGIATTPDYRTLNSNAKPVAGFYALGSLLKGRLYESVAVPELRVQVQELAQALWAQHGQGR